MGTGYTRNDTGNNIADGNIISASDIDGEYDAIESAFNESTGHTHDGTAAEGAPVTVLGPVQDFIASATEIKPKTTNTLDIGTVSLQFKDMYLDGTAYIDGLGEDILVATDKKVQFRDTALFINSSVDGQLDIDADVELELVAPTVDIDASTAVTIDTATLTVTGSANVVGDLDVDNININGNTISSTDTNGNIALTPNGTGEVDISKVDIDSGAIDGTVIGANSAAAITGTTITGTSFVTTGDMTFGDSDKAIFGAGSDLQIYHNPSVGSIIEDTGAGALFVRGSNSVQIETTAGVDMLLASEGGAVTAYYNGSAKLATTATGVDVTGTVTSDGLTVDAGGVLSIGSNNASTVSDISLSGNAVIGGDSSLNITTGANGFLVRTGATDASAGYSDGLNALYVADGGDISFYEDTGTTAKFFWDASAESLGIGTTPEAKLHISTGGGIVPFASSQIVSESAGNNYIELNGGSASTTALYFGDSADQDAGGVLYSHSNDSMNLRVNAQSRMTIDSSGNVAIGTSSPATRLDVLGSINNGVRVSDGTTTGIFYASAEDTNSIAVGTTTNHPLILYTNNAPRMRITSSGNVGIGTSPTYKLDVVSAGSPSQRIRNFDAGGTATLLLETANTFSGTCQTYVRAIGTAGSGVSQLAFGTAISAADTTATERMRIHSSGNLLVGYTSSNGAYKLQVNSQIFATSATIATSDGNYKENVTPLDGALSLVSQLNPVQFDWKEHPVHEFDRNQPTIGFIAQEVQQVLAEQPYLNSIVKSNECVLEPEETDDEGNVVKEAVTEPFLGIAEGNMVALLTAAIKEQQATITALEARIAALEAN